MGSGYVTNIASQGYTAFGMDFLLVYCPKTKVQLAPHGLGDYVVSSVSVSVTRKTDAGRIKMARKLRWKISACVWQEKSCAFGAQTNKIQSALYYTCLISNGSM
jgi:hypothetical protein